MRMMILGFRSSNLASVSFRMPLGGYALASSYLISLHRVCPLVKAALPVVVAEVEGD